MRGTDNVECRDQDEGYRDRAARKRKRVSEREKKRAYQREGVGGSGGERLGEPRYRGGGGGSERGRQMGSELEGQGRVLTRGTLSAILAQL